MTKRFAVFLILLSCAVAQQPHYFTPVLHGSQAPRGPLAGNEGSLGVDVKKENGAWRINIVVPGGPAAKGGLHVGDVITAIGGKSTVGLSAGVFYDMLRSRPGDSINITFLRGTQEQTVALKAASRLSVYPAEASLPPAISDTVFDDWDITMLLGQAANTPNGVTLWVRIASESDSPVMNLNIGKFFILDGTQQQLSEVTGDQMKYVIEQTVAQNLRGGNYVLPPPQAQKRYTITGTGSGTYTVNDVGGGTSLVSSHSCDA